MSKISINGSGQNTLYEQDKTLDGFYVDVSCTTIGDLTVAVLQTFTLVGQLYRDGAPNLTVISGNLFALGTAANPSSWVGNTEDTNHKCFFVSLGNHLALKGADRLNLTITAPAGVTGLNTVISTRYSNGIEEYTPQVQMFPVNQNQTTQNIPAGDNVTAISVINTTTDFRVSAITASSDMWQGEFDKADFRAMLANQWTRTPSPFSFLLYAGCPMDDVQLTATVDSGASSTGYVVVYGGVRSPKVTQRAVERLGKIQRKTAAKYHLGRR